MIDWKDQVEDVLEYKGSFLNFTQPVEKPFAKKDYDDFTMYNFGSPSKPQ